MKPWNRPATIVRFTANMFRSAKLSASGKRRRLTSSVRAGRLPRTTLFSVKERVRHLVHLARSPHERFARGCPRSDDFCPFERIRDAPLNDPLKVGPAADHDQRVREIPARKQAVEGTGDFDKARPSWRHGRPNADTFQSPDAAGGAAVDRFPRNE